MRGQGGVHLYTHAYPALDPRAGVVVVHGYGEHSGRYAHVIAALNAAGYSAFALDHRAHGQSEGVNKANHRAYVDRMNWIIDDLHAFIIGEVWPIHAGKPLFVLGHSMGALITLAYGLRYGTTDQIDGLIASAAPVIADANVSPALIAVGEVLNRLAPTLPLVETVPLNTLSRDPAVLQAFTDDPLTYKGKMRVGTGIQVNRMAKWVRAHLPELILPLLLLHGEADHAVTIEGSRYAYQHAGSQDKTLKTYPGLYHEIMNEPEQAAVLQDIFVWLNQHLNQHLPPTAS